MHSEKYEIVTLPAYRAIGLKWDGPYTSIRDLKALIKQMRERAAELEFAVNPQVLLGLSYHLRADGFVHYSMYEAGEHQQLPDGMVEKLVPEMTYLKTYHRKGDNVGHTYEQIFSWLQANAYTPYREPDVQYYDQLPIKHERYPHDQDEHDPHFDIYIPLLC